ncbi:MAG TPA: protein kinase [Rhodanobacteraceae bacterium]|nr:protein kinase [Rhodanobacteraceae bacterium]
MNASRLDELFDAAQDIPLQKRAAWLDESCGNDMELRHALERLLAADAHPGGVLESAATLLTEVMVESTATPSAFGVWQVQGSLGAGGMGAVWLAERDDAGFVQRAAIKQVAYPTPGLLQRFERERQILARLEHPGIARLIDGGVDDAGCPYLAMEYVEGQRIDQWAREHTLDVRATVKLLLHVCDTVQYAHRNLVVHSDIKPSNILVGADGKPRLLDFGIAKVISEQAGPDTQTAARLMTPDYAAPEWLAGAPATTAVDVYALGVLAYELLAGNKPYRLGRGGMATSELADTTATAPSAAVQANRPDARRRKKLLHGDLDRIVLTAMAADPARRYATVAALATDLDHWLDGKPVAARGDGALYRLRKFVARNRVATATVIIAVLALLGATAYSLRQTQLARQQAMRAEAVRNFLDNTFAQMEPVSNHGKTVSLHDLLGHSERRLAKSSDMPLQVRVDLTTMIGKLYWNLADNANSERALRAAVALADNSVPADIRAQSLLALAIVEHDRGETDSAFHHASLAHQLARRSAATDHTLADAAQRKLASMAIAHEGARRAVPLLRAQLASDRARHGDSQQTIDDLTMLGRALDIMARYVESEITLTEAVAMARREGGSYRSRLGLALDLLGITQLHRGNYAAAEQTFTEAGAVTGGLWGENNVRASITRQQALMATALQGRFAHALPKAMAVRDEAEGMVQSRPDHLASSWRLLGDIRRGLGQLQAAEAAYRQAVSMWEKVPQGDRSDGIAATWSALSAVLCLQGRLADAEHAAHQAIAADQHAVSDAVPWLARDLAQLAEVLRRENRFPEALKQAQSAAAELPAEAGSLSPQTVRVQAQLAQALLDDKQNAAALKQACKAVATARKVLANDNWQNAAVLLTLARAQLAVGRTTDAVSTAQRALTLRTPRLPSTDPRVREIQAVLEKASRAEDHAGAG